MESLLSVDENRMHGKAFCGDRALTTAVYSGNVDCIILLLKKGANIDNKSTYYEQTPLHVAVLKGDEKCLNVILNARANANTLSNAGFTPLYDAVLKGHIECFKRLMDTEEIDVNNLGNSSEETPL